MAGASRLEIEKWLEKACHPAIRSGSKEPIRGIQLRQMRAQGGTDEVQDYPLPEGDYGNLGELAQTILQDAIEYAEGVGGLVKFVLFAFYGQDQTPGKRKPFIIQGNDRIDMDGSNDMESSEPASSQGLLSQLMRHNEAIMRLAVGGQSQVQQTLLRTNDRLAERMEKMDERHFKTIELGEELLDMKQKREVDFLQVKKKEERKDAAFGMMLKFSPHLLSAFTRAVLPKLTGGSAPPQEQHAPAHPLGLPGQGAPGHNSSIQVSPSDPPHGQVYARAPEPLNIPRSRASLVQEVLTAAEHEKAASMEAQLAAVDQLIDLIEEDQITPLMGVLTQEQVLLFFSLYKVNKAAKEANRSAASAAPDLPVEGPTLDSKNGHSPTSPA